MPEEYFQELKNKYEGHLQDFHKKESKSELINVKIPFMIIIANLVGFFIYFAISVNKHLDPTYPGSPMDVIIVGNICGFVSVFLILYIHKYIKKTKTYREEYRDTVSKELMETVYQNVQYDVNEKQSFNDSNNEKLILNFLERKGIIPSCKMNYGNHVLLLDNVVVFPKYPNGETEEKIYLYAEIDLSNKTNYDIMFLDGPLESIDVSEMNKMRIDLNQFKHDVYVNGENSSKIINNDMLIKFLQILEKYPSHFSLLVSGNKLYFKIYDRNAFVCEYDRDNIISINRLKKNYAILCLIRDIYLLFEEVLYSNN